MEIQQLKYFVEVVRQQSFTKAAAQLFVTQPMLTRSIKHLEEELNVRLLERTSKSFCLTDAGRILYERVQDFLLQYDDIFRTMTDVRSARVGEGPHEYPRGAAGRLLPDPAHLLPPSFPRHRHFGGGGGLQAGGLLGGIRPGPTWVWSCCRWTNPTALRARPSSATSAPWW